MSQDKRATGGLPSLELIEQTHDFPGSYAVKVFGPNEARFRERVEAVARACFEGLTPPQISARASAKGNHLCVTVEAHVQHAHQVLALYQELRTIEGVKMML